MAGEAEPESCNPRPRRRRRAPSEGFFWRGPGSTVSWAEDAKPKALCGREPLPPSTWRD
jgi:hypothetical protein